jgi:hypothetical protein
MLHELRHHEELAPLGREGGLAWELIERAADCDESSGQDGYRCGVTIGIFVEQTPKSVERRALLEPTDPVGMLGKTRERENLAETTDFFRVKPRFRQRVKVRPILRIRVPP